MLVQYIVYEVSFFINRILCTNPKFEMKNLRGSNLCNKWLNGVVSHTRHEIRPAALLTIHCVRKNNKSCARFCVTLIIAKFFAPFSVGINSWLLIYTMYQVFRLVIIRKIIKTKNTIVFLGAKIYIFEINISK